MESLYRKYRPQTFDDVVGQQHVVSTLEHAVLEGRASHAYLFCGPRGTGKTTMARLLAKALMCEQGAGHLPDGTCEQCKLIAVGEHPDVYELDAASRTGVDNVREEIISRVSFAPVMGSHKVYIVDEVHMLTTAAFNALLKTLEEPPSHVTFVLCTTDPQKVPETILSRVQRFDFHAISNDELLARLVYVCEQEGFAFERPALELVVRHARGGMRDALSSLEQLSVFGAGSITFDAASDLLGEVATSTLSATALSLARRDVPSLFAEVGELVDAGRDLLQFSRELAAHLRDVYVVAAVGARSGVVSATDEELAELSAEAEAFGSVDRLARALDILGQAASEMRTATNQRLVLELAFTRIARPNGDLTLDALADRVAELERQVRALAAPGRAVTPAPAAVPAAVSASAPAPAPAATPAAAPAPASAPAPAATPAADSVPAPASVVEGKPVPHPQTAAAAQVKPVQAQAPLSQPARVLQASQASQVPQVSRAPQMPAPAPEPQPAKASAVPTPGRAPAPAPSEPAPVAPAPVAVQPAGASDPGELQRRWRQVVDALMAREPARGSLLMSSTLESDDGTVLTVDLHQASPFTSKMLARADVAEAVESVVAEVLGRRRISYAASGTAAPQPVAQPSPAPAAPASAPADQAASVSTSSSVPASPVVPAQTAPAPAPAATIASAAQSAAVPTGQSAPASGAPTVQAPVVQQLVAAVPPEPVPADQPPYDDYVPYDEFVDDNYVDLPWDEPVAAPEPASQPVAVPPAPAPVPAAPDAQPASHAPAQPPAPAPAQPPAPTPAQQPAPAPTPAAAPSPTVDLPVFDPEDPASVMAMLTHVFGEGVTDRSEA